MDKVQKRRVRMQAFLKGVVTKTPYLHESSSLAQITDISSVSHFFVKAQKDQIQLLPEITVKLFTSIAFFRLIDKQYVEAFQTIERLKVFAKENFNSVELANAYLVMGDFCFLSHRSSIALDYYISAANVCSEKIGKDTIFLTKILRKIASGYKRTGQMQQALEYYLKIFQMHCRIEGANSHSAYSVYLRDYLPLFMEVRKGEDFVSHLNNILEQCLKDFEENHLFTLETRMLLAKALLNSARGYSKIGKNHKTIMAVESQLQQALLISNILYGEESKSTGLVLGEISETYFSISDMTQLNFHKLLAQDYALRSTKVLQKALGPENTIVLDDLSGRLFTFYGSGFLPPMSLKSRNFVPELENILDVFDFEKVDAKQAATYCVFLAAFYSYNPVLDIDKAEQFYFRALELLSKSISPDILFDEGQIVGKLSNFYVQKARDARKSIEWGLRAVKLKEKHIENIKVIKDGCNPREKSYWRDKLMALQSDLYHLCHGLLHTYRTATTHKVLGEFEEDNALFTELQELVSKHIRLLDEYTGRSTT